MKKDEKSTGGHLGVPAEKDMEERKITLFPSLLVAGSLKQYWVPKYRLKTHSFRKETKEWAQQKITLLVEKKMGHRVQTSNKVKKSHH